MLFQLSLMIAFAFASLLANQEKSVTKCCTSGAERLAPQKVKALLDTTEPIHAPCCADMLHIKGTMILSIEVGTDGEVTCVAYVSGHPIILGVAIDSVRQWRFRPHAVKGLKRNFCGRVALRYEATEHAVKYEVI